MSTDEEKEKHRKHLKAKFKERRKRSEIARKLLQDPQYRQKKGPRLEEREERIFRKYKHIIEDEENESS